MMPGLLHAPLLGVNDQLFQCCFPVAERFCSLVVWSGVVAYYDNGFSSAA